MAVKEGPFLGRGRSITDRGLRYAERSLSLKRREMTGREARENSLYRSQKGQTNSCLDNGSADHDTEAPEVRFTRGKKVRLGKCSEKGKKGTSQTRACSSYQDIRIHKQELKSLSRRITRLMSDNLSVSFLHEHNGKLDVEIIKQQQCSKSLDKENARQCGDVINDNLAAPPNHHLKAKKGSKLVAKMCRKGQENKWLRRVTRSTLTDQLAGKQKINCEKAAQLPLGGKDASNAERGRELEPKGLECSHEAQHFEGEMAEADIDRRTTRAMLITSDGQRICGTNIINQDEVREGNRAHDMIPGGIMTNEPVKTLTHKKKINGKKGFCVHVQTSPSVVTRQKLMAAKVLETSSCTVTRTTKAKSSSSNIAKRNPERARNPLVEETQNLEENANEAERNLRTCQKEEQLMYNKDPGIVATAMESEVSQNCGKKGNEQNQKLLGSGRCDITKRVTVVEDTIHAQRMEVPQTEVIIANKVIGKQPQLRCKRRDGLLILSKLSGRRIKSKNKEEVNITNGPIDSLYQMPIYSTGAKGGVAGMAERKLEGRQEGATHEKKLWVIESSLKHRLRGSGRHEGNVSRSVKQTERKRQGENLPDIPSKKSKSKGDVQKGRKSTINSETEALAVGLLDCSDSALGTQKDNIADIRNSVLERPVSQSAIHQTESSIHLPVESQKFGELIIPMDWGGPKFCRGFRNLTDLYGREESMDIDGDNKKLQRDILCFKFSKTQQRGKGEAFPIIGNSGRSYSEATVHGMPVDVIETLPANLHSAIIETTGTLADMNKQVDLQNMKHGNFKHVQMEAAQPERQDTCERHVGTRKSVITTRSQNNMLEQWPDTDVLSCSGVGTGFHNCQQGIENMHVEVNGDKECASRGDGIIGDCTIFESAEVNADSRNGGETIMRREIECSMSGPQKGNATSLEENRKSEVEQYKDKMHVLTQPDNSKGCQAIPGMVCNIVRVTNLLEEHYMSPVNAARADPNISVVDECRGQNHESGKVVEKAIEVASVDNDQGLHGIGNSRLCQNAIVSAQIDHINIMEPNNLAQTNSKKRKARVQFEVKEIETPPKRMQDGSYEEEGTIRIDGKRKGFLVDIVDSVGRRIRPRLLDPEQPMLVFVEGKDKDYYDYDGGSFFRWLQQQEKFMDIENCEKCELATSPHKEKIFVPSYRNLPLSMKCTNVVACGSSSNMNHIVDYDMDEEDDQWLQAFNNALIVRGEWEFLSENKFEKIIEFLEKESARYSKGTDEIYTNQQKNALQCKTDFNGGHETPNALCKEMQMPAFTGCCLCNGGENRSSNPVYTCRMCEVNVHLSCYGIQDLVEDKTGEVNTRHDWICKKCKAVEKGDIPLDISCAICCKDGGALKPSVDPKKWAHVSCALYTDETFFVNPDKMEPIDGLDAVGLRVRKHRDRCQLCGEKKGSCAQCSAKGCGARFHVSCGISRGALFELQLSKQQVTAVRSFCIHHANCVSAMNVVGMPGAITNSSVGEFMHAGKGRQRLKDKARKRGDISRRRRNRSISEGSTKCRNRETEIMQDGQMQCTREGTALQQIADVHDPISLDLGTHNLIKLQDALKVGLASPFIVHDVYAYWQTKRAKSKGPLLQEYQQVEASQAYGIFNKEAEFANDCPCDTEEQP